MSAQFQLLRESRYQPFFVTQFLGAFNDNLFKNALVVLITFDAARLSTLPPGVLVNLAAGLFILPFFLFSPTAGQLADRCEKRLAIRRLKLLEIVVMTLATVAFALDSLALLLLALFLMGTQSAFFSPIKYALPPQVLAPHELIGGNALLEMGTFLAILLGTLSGGLLVALPSGTTWVSAAVLALAVIGYLASGRIGSLPAPSPGLRLEPRPWRMVGDLARRIRAVPGMLVCAVAISWFWFFGAVMLSQFPGLGAGVLGGDEHLVTLLLTLFSVGIGTGSLMCERLSRGRIELALVPLGAVGMVLAGLDLAWAASQVSAAQTAQPLSAALAQPGVWRVLLDLTVLAACGGLYIVPLYAWMQHHAPAHERARIIAGSNMLDALFMVTAAGMGAGLLAAGVGVTGLIAITAILGALVCAALFVAQPAFLAALRDRLGRGRGRAG